MGFLKFGLISSDLCPLEISVLCFHLGNFVT